MESRTWLCEEDTLVGEIASAVNAPPDLSESGKWLDWWWKAEHFRRAVSAADRRIEKEVRSLPDRGAEAVLDSCSRPDEERGEPSLGVLSLAFRGMDGGLLADWTRWCEKNLLPSPRAALLPRAALAGRGGAGIHEEAAPFSVHQDWARLSDAFARLGDQYRADEGAALREWIADGGKRDRGWCEEGLRRCERALFLGLARDRPWEIAGQAREVLTELLATELKGAPEGDAAALDRRFEDGARQGISPWRLAKFHTGAVGRRLSTHLEQGDLALAERRLATARERFEDLQSSDRSPGGRVSFDAFREGVTALAEARALGATIPPALLDQCAEWRAAFEKLERLRIFADAAEAECTDLKGRVRSLRFERSEDLERRLAEIRSRTEVQRAQFHSTKANLVARDGRSKSDLGENGYAPAKKIVEGEIRRRRIARIRALTTAVVAVLLAWIAIDTYFRASGEADQRIADLSVLKHEASLELVEEALVSAESTGGIDGLFRLFPKWKQEAEDTSAWIDEQRELSTRLGQHLASLRQFPDGMSPYPGWTEAGQWTESLRNWTATESEFVSARDVVARLAPGVARPEKDEFSALDSQWQEAQGLRAQAFGEDLDRLDETYQAFLDEAKAGRNQPDMDRILERAGSLNSEYSAADQAIVAAGAASPPLAPLRAVLDKKSEGLAGRKAALELSIADIRRLQSRLDTLSGSSGVPTFVRNLDPFVEIPASVADFLPADLAYFAKRIQDALGGSALFDELVFRDFASLGTISSDPPVPPTISDEISSAMTNLIDDWKLKDIIAWREREDGPINAFSRGRPVKETREDGSVFWNVDAYLPVESPTLARFRSFAVSESSQGGKRSLIGEFPKGVAKSARESDFFATLDLGLVYSMQTRGFKNSPFLVLDKLIAEATRKGGPKDPVNLVMIAYLQRELGKVVAADPEAWGAHLTSFSSDFHTLVNLRRDGVQLDFQSEDWMVPEITARWKNPLESYYLLIADRSYVLEYRENASKARSIAGGARFQFMGYTDLTGRPVPKDAAFPAGATLWGVRENPVSRKLEAAPSFRVATNGTLTEINRPAPLSPLIAGSADFERFYESTATNAALASLLNYQ